MQPASNQKDHTKALLYDCALYLRNNQTRPNYILASFGIIVSILSLATSQKLNIFLLGLLVFLWASFLKPRYFSLHSPDCLLFWFNGRSTNPSKNIGIQIDFTLKLVRALDGHSSPFRLLNGRFYLAQKTLSDYFLLGFQAEELLKALETSKHKGYLNKALNAVVLLNTLMALVLSEDQESIHWPDNYQSALSKIARPDEPIAITQLLADYYPQLFQQQGT